MTKHSIPRVRIYHVGVWAKYKGAIFSRIHANSERCGVDTSFVQISESNKQRAMLSGVDLSYHQYPFELLFRGYSDGIPQYKIAVALVANVLRHRNELVVIPGYHRVEYWAMLAICMLLRRRRAVFVDSTAYESKKTRFKEAAKAFFFRRCDGFFCYGIRSKEYVASYGVDERKIFFRCQAAALPHGYDGAAIRSRYAAHQRDAAAPARFLYFGRLSVEKGLYDLLDAFCLLQTRMPGATLRIVGSGLLEREIKERAQQLGLGSVVQFLGSMDLEATGQILMDSTAMILPSRSEPWGLVVNESFSYGCPVVVSDVCGCVPELVREGETGYSFPAGDVSALCAAMIAVAELSKDRMSVAYRCMDLIEQYTPERAALEILRGCVQFTNTPQ